ncbi:repeat 21B-like [Octopus vulgaris]|uniref:Repeat 21B-like n=1 Tax=Octopus vulgaris TaxID=6645 RepID=A0AA36F138_OCTVU|nr:repeat 21B-like [Octopus vulgaris]
MAEEDSVLMAKIFYYGHHKYFGRFEVAVTDGLTKYNNDPILKFYKALALLLQGRVPESMHAFQQLKDKVDVNLGSILALIYGYKKSKNNNREELQDLDRKLKEERKQAGERSLLYAGTLLFLIEKYDKAKEYLDRALKLNELNKQSLALKGWLELESGKDPHGKKAFKYFDEIIRMSDGAGEVNAFLGLIRCFMARCSFNKALEIANQLIVGRSDFLPALEEKMKIQLALKDWDQSVETAYLALDIDQFNIEALTILTLYHLCCLGDYNESSGYLERLLDSLNKTEQSSYSIYHKRASLFCRICGRNELILQHTHTLAQCSVEEGNCNAEYMREVAYQFLLSGKVKEAMENYKETIKLDETHLPAVTGIIECQLLMDKIEDASHQLEFLNEIQMSIGHTAELYYLSAVLGKKKQNKEDNTIVLLNEAVNKHFSTFKTLYLSYEYFIKLNPDFLIQITNDYLDYGPQQPSQYGQPLDPILKKCLQILDPVTKMLPGLFKGVYLLAKVKYLCGDFEAAQATLQHCLDQDQSLSSAHILMAQIHLHLNNFKLASQSLEFGLSHNFQVRDHPIYHLISARIQKKQGELADASETLKFAMNLPGMKASDKMNNKEKNQISVNDKVSVFLELADTHKLLGEQHEAAKVMQDAINEFQGTPEEVRITIANVDLALARGDIEMALGTLRNVGSEQQYFIQAREKMADIYLNYRKNKTLYANCYRELAERKPSVHTSLLLGDAYMSIQEPDKAIDIYEEALKMNPKDTTLAHKIGKALVKTHQYGKAVTYYEAAIRSGNQSQFCIDLAELQFRLKQYDKSEKILKHVLEEDILYSDLDTMIVHANCMALLARLYQQIHCNEAAMLYFSKAKDLQIKIYQRIQTEQPDAVASQRQTITKICCELAKHTFVMQESDRAMSFYNEALTFNDGDVEAMLELAKVYLMSGDLDSCQSQCLSLLKKDKDNVAATMMLSNVYFYKNSFEEAIKHYKQLLEKKPDNYEVLAKLIDAMKCNGQLDEVPKFLESIKEALTCAKMEAGYYFCHGLYNRLISSSTIALKSFNMARKDTTWSNSALYNMVEICLNPDSETIGGEVFESVDNSDGYDQQRTNNERVALRTAEKLLKEVKPQEDNTQLQIMKNMVLVSTKNKANVEKALMNFMEIVSTYNDNVGALYGMATAYMVQKQVPKARNQLKRIVKLNWTCENAEIMEKSWLLLADIHIQSGKYDMAQELLKKCLTHNKSCCKAYEYSGFIMEKEQSHKDAAEYYEKAWIHGRKNNPVIGYKLAFNYLKAKRYTEAIDICNLVLASHPNYPKIQKEILTKARSNWRT